MTAGNIRVTPNAAQPKLTHIAAWRFTRPDTAPPGRSQPPARPLVAARPAARNRPPARSQPPPVRNRPPARGRPPRDRFALKYHYGCSATLHAGCYGDPSVPLCRHVPVLRCSNKCSHNGVRRLRAARAGQRAGSGPPVAMIACTCTPWAGSGAHFGILMLPRQVVHAAAVDRQLPYRGKTDAQWPFFDYRVYLHP